MHIAEGVLSPAVLATGYALTAAGTALGLNGIWWALTISSIVKGIIFFGYYLHIMKRMKA